MDRRRKQEAKILQLARKIAAELDSGKFDGVLEPEQIEVVAALLARSPRCGTRVAATTVR